MPNDAGNMHAQRNPPVDASAEAVEPQMERLTRADTQHLAARRTLPRHAPRPARKSSEALASRKAGGHSEKLQALQIDKSLCVLERKARIKREYKVLGQLGSGSFGVVKKVLHVPTGAVRALK